MIHINDKPINSYFITQPGWYQDEFFDLWELKPTILETQGNAAVVNLRGPKGTKMFYKKSGSVVTLQDAAKIVGYFPKEDYPEMYL